MFAKRSISRIFSVLFAIVFTLSVTPLQAAHAAGVRYATPGGTGDCSSWVDACTLQTALTGATSGDEIWVAAGTYKPTTDPTDRTATFQLISGVALYGGFAGTETARNQRDPAAHVTVLSGDIGASGDSGDNSYHVVTGADGAVLDGFTITAGNANGSIDTGDDSGGGIFNSSSSPTVMNVTFTNNSASSNGGGMYNDSSNPTLTDVTFANNWASGYGGGMRNDNSSSPTLMNVTFTNNSAWVGGGMDNWSANPTLTNVTFSGNSADDGGGMDNYNGNPVLTNVTFRSNSAYRGGGIENCGGSPAIRNTIFWGNTAFDDGVSIYNNCGATAAVSYSIVQGGYPSGTNILSADPLLGPFGNYGGFTQTIPLQAGSSAIDTGNDATCPATDQRGVTRPQGAHCDISAYELDTTAPIVNSITRLNPSPTNLASVNFTVTFSESVTGVNGSDFSLTTAGFPALM